MCSAAGKGSRAQEEEQNLVLRGWGTGSQKAAGRWSARRGHGTVLLFILGAPLSAGEGFAFCIKNGLEFPLWLSSKEPN